MICNDRYRRSDMNDRDIINKLKGHNESGIEELIDKYGQYVGSVIYRVAKSALGSEDIEEIASDVFCTIWQTRKRIKEVDSLKPYLAQIARNMTRNKMRRTKIHRSLDELVLVLQTESNDELFVQKEKIAIIKEFLTSIKHPDKEILAAYYFSNQKLEQISDHYNLPLSTIKSKIYRGRKSIIEHFERKGYTYED